jgi:hypothetical protein
MKAVRVTFRFYRARKNSYLVRVGSRERARQYPTKDSKQRWRCIAAGSAAKKKRRAVDRPRAARLQGACNRKSSYP